MKIRCAYRLGYLSVKATSVDEDATLRCGVQDIDVNSAVQWRETISCRPDAVGRCELNADDIVKHYVRVAQHRSNERHDTMMCLRDVDLSKPQLALTLHRHLADKPTR